MNTAYAIETGNLTKVFGTHRVVDGIDLKVPKGSIYGFLGRNGAGKTTSMRMLLGLIKPSAGSIELLNEKVVIDGKEQRRTRLSVAKKVGCLIEGPAFYPFLSGRKNLTLFAKLSGIKDPKLVESMLDKVGLLGRDHDLFGVYSRGMKQRLGIAATLISDPELILLDEPMNGLDPAGVVLIRDLLIERAKNGATIFMSSHLLNDAEQFCTDIGILHLGKMVAQGPLHELCRSDLATIEITLEPCDDLSSVLKPLDYVKDFDIQENLLHVTLERGSEAKLNKALVEANCAISALVPKRRSLENLFLDHIQQTVTPTQSPSL